MKKELEIRLKILRLYKLLCNKNLSAKEIKDIYIEYLKLSVCLGTNQPCFKENLKTYRHVNCYGYALGIDLPEYIYQKYCNVEFLGISHKLGFASERRPPTNAQEKLDNLYSDLEVLKIQFFETDIEKQNQHDGYKIALYSDPREGYHFMRQNRDGLWSEKIGYSSTVMQSEKPRPFGEEYQLLKTLEIVKPTIK